MQFHEKNNFDLSGFTSFFAWTFLNFLARCAPNRPIFFSLFILLNIGVVHDPSLQMFDKVESHWMEMNKEHKILGNPQNVWAKNFFRYTSRNIHSYMVTWMWAYLWF